MPGKKSVTHTDVQGDLTDIFGRFCINLGFLTLLPQTFTASWWPPYDDFPLNCFIKNKNKSQLSKERGKLKQIKNKMEYGDKRQSKHRVEQ